MASSTEREDRPTEESPPECGEEERLLLQFHASASAGGGLAQGRGNTDVVYTSRDWACGWCKVPQSDATGKGPGPDGPATLCKKCNSRFRTEQTGPALQLPANADGKYECDRCDRTFASAGAVQTHRRSCAGRDWACGWCKATQSDATGKGRGPDGPATLCLKCSSRFGKGHTGPAPQLPTNADGKYECDRCDRTFANASAVQTHCRSCAGRDWACGWCKATQSETTGKRRGPDGPATLCCKCSYRFRSAPSKRQKCHNTAKGTCGAAVASAGAATALPLQVAGAPYHHDLLCCSSSSTTTSTSGSSSSSSSSSSTSTSRASATATATSADAWTQREQIAFVLGMHRHGCDCTRIAQLVVTRSPQQVQGHFDRYLLGPLLVSATSQHNELNYNKRTSVCIMDLI